MAGRGRVATVASNPAGATKLRDSSPCATGTSFGAPIEITQSLRRLSAE
jgi:hypothetical protein